MLYLFVENKVEIQLTTHVLDMRGGKDPYLLGVGDAKRSSSNE